MEGSKGQAQAAGTLTVRLPGRCGAEAGACLLLLCIGLPASAEIYRWRDEQGHLQFGDRPPSGVAVERVDTGPVPAPDADAVSPDAAPDSGAPDSTVPDSAAPDEEVQRKRVLEVLGEERKKREEAREAERAARKEQREKCAQARQELEEMRQARFFYDPGSDPDNPTILGDAERDSLTRKKELAVRQLCGS